MNSETEQVAARLAEAERRPHDSGCTWWIGGLSECDCGRDARIAELKRGMVSQ
jgi:hypothetical protein